MPPAAVLNYPQLEAIALALALGLLVGVQRGWTARHVPAGSRFAGIRTFGLLGLAGGIAGAMQPRAGAMTAVLLAASASLVVIGYWRSAARADSISGTASVAGLLTLACGYMAGAGEFALASAASGIMLLVLALRSRLHGWLRVLDEQEVTAIARFALIALVILPLLPDTAFGPYDAWRPRQLWLVVVMVSGFSFLGYFAAQHLGAARGILVTAAAGSMVSSTAVTAALAARLRDGEDDPAILNAGIALASAVMFVRVMVLTGALAAFALPTLALFAVPGLVVSLLACAWQLRRRAPGTAGSVPPVALSNPLAFGPALLLMGLVMVTTVAAQWMLVRFGDAGLAVMLAITGAFDVDSAIITLGNLPGSPLRPAVAGLVLLSPIVLNSLFKASTALSIAGWSKAKAGALALVLSVIAAVAAVPFVV
jgi:uncharacterized membrane protein (DUF4010 family)